MSSPSYVLAHLGAPPITPTELAHPELIHQPALGARLTGDVAHAHHRKRAIRIHMHLHAFAFFLNAGREAFCWKSSR